jgi:hypothetical protein
MVHACSTCRLVLDRHKVIRCKLLALARITLRSGGGYSALYTPQNLVEKGLLCGGEEGALMNVGDTGVNRGGISPQKLNYSYI